MCVYIYIYIYDDFVKVNWLTGVSCNMYMWQHVHTFADLSLGRLPKLIALSKYPHLLSWPLESACARQVQDCPRS